MHALGVRVLVPICPLNFFLTIWLPNFELLAYHGCCSTSWRPAVPSRVVVAFLPAGSPSSPLFARSPIPHISPAHAHASSCAHMPPPMAPGYLNENSESYLANLLENCHAFIVNCTILYTSLLLSCVSRKKTLLTYLLTYTFVLSIRAPGHTCFSVLLYFLVTQGHPHGWRSLSQVWAQKPIFSKPSKKAGNRKKEGWGCRVG